MTRLEELLNCGIPEDLARQIKEEFDDILRENNTLRGILANSDLACVYCGLSKTDQIKCSHGFPGCPRADDSINSPLPF